MLRAVVPEWNAAAAETLWRSITAARSPADRRPASGAHRGRTLRRIQARDGWQLPSSGGESRRLSRSRRAAAELGDLWVDISKRQGRGQNGRRFAESRRLAVDRQPQCFQEARFPEVVAGQRLAIAAFTVRPDDQQRRAFPGGQRIWTNDRARRAAQRVPYAPFAGRPERELGASRFAPLSTPTPSRSTSSPPSQPPMAPSTRPTTSMANRDEVVSSCAAL